MNASLTILAPLVIELGLIADCIVDGSVPVFVTSKKHKLYPAEICLQGNSHAEILDHLRTHIENTRREAISLDYNADWVTRITYRDDIGWSQGYRGADNEIKYYFLYTSVITIRRDHVPALELVA
jgi:hypothetical protein